MLRRVGNPLIASLGMPSDIAFPCEFEPFGSSRERLSRYTPEKIIRKPQRSESVFTAEAVLKPWKRRHEAMRVHVVNVT